MPINPALRFFEWISLKKTNTVSNRIPSGPQRTAKSQKRREFYPPAQGKPVYRLFMAAQCDRRVHILSDNYTQDEAPEGYEGVSGNHTWMDN